MLSVAEALQRLTADVAPLPAERVALDDASSRVLAENLAARLTQPPFPSSAMDGYAVRRVDLGALPARLRIVGESAAGHPYGKELGERETVRIFTGGVVPPGADHIVIQENVSAADGWAEVAEVNAEAFIRARGIDFREGEATLRAGRRLTARDLMLVAQMNHAELPVRRRPKVAILASGDELVPPGGSPGEGEIISAIPTGLAAMLQKGGAEVRALGIAQDTLEDLDAHIARASDADILITIGGASVGDHDLVRQALESAGFAIAFHKIAMRPGKPLMSGHRGDQRVIGLPGNPVSAMICTLIFVLPLIDALLGAEQPRTGLTPMPLATPLPKNGPRQHYMRARYVSGPEETRAVEAFESQDSSLTSVLAAADCLIVRAPHAPALEIGAEVPTLPLDF